MTAGPWGRTGRVVHNFLSAVLVDGLAAGAAFPSTDKPGAWFAAVWPDDESVDATCRNDLPSLDAAVMWVLAHANGPTPLARKRIRDVWRAERGPTWHVWALPVPSDPFGPRGWQWYAGPTRDDFTVLPSVWDGPNTPHRGDRTWIRVVAHRSATLTRTHAERTHP